MKTAILILVAVVGLSFGTLAQAEVRTEIQAVSAISYVRGQLTGSYSIGGGCAEHVAAVDVKIQKTKKETYDSYKAIVVVSDVSSAQDDCEAYLHRTFDVDLKKLIEEKAAAAGFQGNTIDVVLPKLMVQW